MSKPREFHILIDPFYEKLPAEDRNNYIGDAFEKPPFKGPIAKETTVRVREVNSELDAAYAECEKALDFAYKHLESMDGYSIVYGARYELKKALAALKKVKGE